MGICRRYRHAFWYMTSGLLIITGVSLLVVFPILTKKLILKNIPLVNGSYSMQQWSNPNYDISIEFWIFNLTNADFVLLYGDKPILDRKGPYSFTETQFKTDIVENDTTGFINYTNVKRFIFNQEKSCLNCSEHDMLTVPNVPYLTAMASMENVPEMSDWVKQLFEFALYAIGENAFTTHSVAELLFDGYEDNLFSLLQYLKAIEQFAHVPDRMGFMYPANKTDAGSFTINSGRFSPENIGQIDNWNGKTRLDIWNSNFSNQILGTDGSLFPPLLKKTSVLKLFVADICRSIYAVFKEQVEVRNIKAYRFYVPKEAFDDTNPDNEGFCQPSEDLFFPKSQKTYKNTSAYCLPAGMLNVTKCRFGAPIVVSNPNFLYSTDEVYSSVYGLSERDLETDGSFLDIEPNTGILLRASRRLQINVAMPKTIKGLKNIRSVVMPVLLLNESALVSTSIRNQLYDSFVLAPRVLLILASISILFGLVICSINTIVMVLRRRRQINHELRQTSPISSTISDRSGSPASVASA